VETCPYTIRKGKEQLAPGEEVLPNQGEQSHEDHSGQCAQSSNGMDKVGESTEVDGQYRPRMVINRTTNGRKGTKAFVSTESTTKSARNAAPQPTPKNSEWRGTSANGPAPVQSMPRKNNGVGDHFGRAGSVWTPIITGLGSTDVSINSKLGPLDSILLTEGAKRFDTDSGLSLSPISQAHSLRKYPPSVKGKKKSLQGA